MIEVVRPGSRATIGGDVEAVVLAVMLMTDGIQYKVAWWDGRCRNEAWIEPAEIGPGPEVERVKVGFANGRAR